MFLNTAVLELGKEAGHSENIQAAVAARMEWPI